MRRYPAFAVVHLVPIVLEPHVVFELVRERLAGTPVGREAEGAGAQGCRADAGGFGHDQVHEVGPDPVAQAVHLAEVVVGGAGEAENIDEAVAVPAYDTSDLSTSATRWRTPLAA